MSTDIPKNNGMEKMCKTIFLASFEENLNLQNDPFSKDFAKANLQSAMEKERFRVTVKSNIWLAVLSLIFIVAPNFLLALIINSGALKHFEVNFLPYGVFWTCLIIWLLLIFLGKFFSQNFILIYRGQFHLFVTYLWWLFIEMNLFSLTMVYKELKLWMIISFASVGIIAITAIVAYRMITLKELMFEKNIKKLKKRERFVSLIVPLSVTAVVIYYVLKIFMPETFKLNLIGYLLMNLAVDIAFVILQMYLFFPFFLQGYYKYKYPEEYRKLEGKTSEEWYGKKYLKKRNK